MNPRGGTSIRPGPFCRGWYFNIFFNFNSIIDPNLYFNKLKLDPVFNKGVFIMFVVNRNIINGCLYNP